MTEVKNEKKMLSLSEPELLASLEKEEDFLSNRVIEISLGVNGTISTAPYENWKPGFFMKCNSLGLTKEMLREQYKQAKAELKHQFNLEKNNCKAEVVAERFNNIGFTAKDGLNYVWVSSVLGYDIVWRIPEFELTQYGSRGTIGHEMAHDYIRKLDLLRKEDPELKRIAEIKWMKPEEEKTLQENVTILKNGSLGMSPDDLSVKKFMEVHGKSITEPEIEISVWNKKHLYTGRADMFCKWNGIPSVIDYKCGKISSDFRQLAAYAVCREDIQQMVLCPIGPTTNVCGFMKPSINTNIKGEFRAFVKKRAQFRKEFGI